MSNDIIRPMSGQHKSPAELAEAIRRVAETAGSEMGLQIEVEKLLDPFLRRVAGITFNRYGHATKLGGIEDALHGNLIIEYERPGKLARPAGLKENVNQLQQYLHEESQRHGHQQAAALRRMVGVGIDGTEILFVRYRGRPGETTTPAKQAKPQLSFFPEAEAGEFSVDGPHPICAQSIETFLGFLQSLARYPLTPEALADTFGPKGSLAPQVVNLFYNKLLKSENRRVQTFFAEWQRIFGIVYGQDIGKAEADARALGKQFGVKTVPKLKQFLFAVHTYFALLMKLLAAEIMTMQSGSMMQSFIQPLGSTSSDDFRKALRNLEDGGLYSSQGITNFLEGDFFAWYLSEWDKAMAQELRSLVKALASFDPRTPYLAPEQSRDLLKKLYQYLVPKKLRHDLGEFYTPDWLAEHLLNQLGYDGNLDKRLLDPACGSGTFLVLAIGRMKRWAEDHDPPIPPEVAAHKILDNLCGFDLNPIAVIAARTNFLLAFGELLRHVRPIEIPIYMCDSVLTPSEYAELFGKGYRIPTAVGEFEIPGEIVNTGQMQKLADLLEQCARGDYTPKEFVNRAKRELAVTHLATLDALRHLYETVHKLEKQNRNGIWARWLKNAFAPVFKGKFDFIAGNPPWINWDSLSMEYRAASGPLWVKHGLVAKAGGKQFELGKQKRDFAMLFTYAALDSYAPERGKLGFLVTQTVFKTRSGDRFRQFRLGSGRSLKVVVAEDLTDIQPFEGAANRTGLVVLQRDQPTEYPVKYVLWRRIAAHAFDTDVPLAEVLKSVSRSDLAAAPVDGKRRDSPWLTGPAAVLGSLNRVSGRSAYQARAGSVTWLNGVYWVNVIEERPDGLLTIENLGEVGKTKIPIGRHPLERDMLYPLLRGRDIERWRTSPSAFIVLPHTKETGWRAIDPTLMKSNTPQTHKFFKQYESFLVKRSGYRQLREGQPFYICSNTGPWLFEPYKVVWREVSGRFEAGVAGDSCSRVLGNKIAVPDHTLVFVGTPLEQEAHFICALLNSSIAALIVTGYVALHASPHVLEHIAVPKFDRENAQHTQLAERSQEAHKLVVTLAGDPRDEKAKRELGKVETEIDHAAAELWGLTDSELSEIRKALELLK